MTHANNGREQNGKKKKSQKQARVWEGQIARGEMESLDYSSKSGMEEDDPESIAAQFADPTKLGKTNKDGIYEVQDIEEEEEDEDEQVTKESIKEAGAGSGMFSFLKSMTGSRELTADTLDPVLSDIKEHLIKKNVASDIAEHLCQSVRSNLLGKKIGSFSSKYHHVSIATCANLDAFRGFNIGS